MISKYKLFFGWRFYPSGGYDDFKGSFDSQEEAINWVESNYDIGMDCWAHIVLEDKILTEGSIDSDFFEQNTKWIWEKNDR